MTFCYTKVVFAKNFVLYIQPVKEVAIKKKSGGVRKPGVPTLLDRIAQEVAKTHLERIVEPQKAHQH